MVRRRGRRRSAAQFEQRYPSSTLPRKQPNPEYIGVSIVRGGVHLSRPKNWMMREASSEPGHSYIQYISPRAYSFGIYERPDGSADVWRDVLNRYEDDVASTGAKVVGKRVPVATAIGQGGPTRSSATSRRPRSPSSADSREIVLRGGAPRRHRADRAPGRQPFCRRRGAHARHQHARGVVVHARSSRRAVVWHWARGEFSGVRAQWSPRRSRMGRGATFRFQSVLKPLPRHGSAGVMPTLKPEDYWSTLLPSIRCWTGHRSTDLRSIALVSQLFTTPELLQAEGPRTGPIKVADADVTVESGPDGFKIVWLRTHQFADGSAAGAARPRSCPRSVRRGLCGRHPPWKRQRVLASRSSGSAPRFC